ncbi:MAG: hypothetical protein CMH56_10980 [Myxococcales bacterium]|nr:hypothetical protein [Myxococcales bacterium]
MLAHLQDWLTLGIRWIHFIAGAAWIGASFYFNWLNHSLRPPEEERDNIGGEVWAVHGGDFFQVNKFKGAPEKLPGTLHWFKWEAYLTWISGFAMLVLVYYLKPGYLVDPSVADITQSQGVMIGLGTIVVGWFVYDLMCKSPLGKNGRLLAIIGFAMVVVVTYALCNVLGSRAAYIHVGAMLGTIMAANVFFVIIPNQRVMVDAMSKGEAPDVSLGEAGALRSLHNNYMTLPVLFVMVSNAHPSTFGHEYNWLILAALTIIGVMTRHYFNLKNKGKKQPLWLVASALGMFILAYLVSPKPAPALSENGAASSPITFAQVQTIMEARCTSCHAEKPTYEAFPTPPKGVILTSYDKIKAHQEQVKTSLETNYMPLGNLTKMTAEERQTVIQWIAQGAQFP